jgi:diaminopimelate decarboxylase
MGFNYNGRLRPQELLLRKDGTVELIRRAETIEDYFSTLNFETKSMSISPQDISTTDNT